MSVAVAAAFKSCCTSSVCLRDSALQFPRPTRSNPNHYLSFLNICLNYLVLLCFMAVSVLVVEVKSEPSAFLLSTIIV